MNNAHTFVPTVSPQRAPQTVIARNAFYLLLGQVISTLLSIGLNAALGRNLGPADFGIYFLLMSMSSFAYVLVDWGQSAILIREVARSPDCVSALLDSALAFRVVVSCALLVLTVCSMRLMGYEQRIQVLAALVVACGLPLALSQTYGYLFRGRNRMDLDATVTVAAKVFTVIATLAVLSLGGRLAWVFVAQFLGGAGALAVAVLLGRRLALPTLRPRWTVVRELGVQGSSLAFFFVALAVQPYLDAIVLSKLTPTSVVGFYGAARNIVGVLIAPASILGAAAFPELSRAALQPLELNRIVRTALRPILLLGALTAVGCYLFAKVAVDVIYGTSGFYPSVEVLEFYAPALFIVFLDMLLGFVVTALGRTRALALAKLGNVLASTVLALVLVPVFQARSGNGGLGIVIAFSVSELLMLFAFAAALPTGTLDRITLLDAARAVLAALGTLALFRLLPPLSPWLSMPLCVVVFGFLALAVGLVSRAELVKFADLLKQTK